jgi:hypothetical protein
LPFAILWQLGLRDWAFGSERLKFGLTHAVMLERGERFEDCSPLLYFPFVQSPVSDLKFERRDHLKSEI